MTAPHPNNFIFFGSDVLDGICLRTVSTALPYVDFDDGRLDGTAPDVDQLSRAKEGVERTGAWWAAQRTTGRDN
jgi:hypothetical protein